MHPTTPTGAHDDGVAGLFLEPVRGRDLRGRAERHRRQAGLDHRAERQRHPDLAGDRLGNLLSARGEAGLDLLEVLRALGGRRLRPRLERRARGLDGAVHVRGIAGRDPPHDLFVGRIDDVEGALARRRRPFAADVELVVVLHAVLVYRFEKKKVGASQ